MKGRYTGKLGFEIAFTNEYGMRFKSTPTRVQGLSSFWI